MFIHHRSFYFLLVMFDGPRSHDVSCSWLLSKKDWCQFRWNSVKYCGYLLCFGWFVCWFVARVSVGWATGIWQWRVEPPAVSHRWSSDESRDAQKVDWKSKIFGPSLDFQQSWSSSSWGCMRWWSRKSDPICCVSMFFLNKKRKCRNRFPYCFFSRIFQNRSLQKCRLIWSLGKSASWSSSHEDSAT